MELEIDLVQPLLQLARGARAPIAVAALRAASRFPWDEAAWRALAREAVRLVDAGAPAAVGQPLFATLAAIPVSSVRRRLRSLATQGAEPAREWAFEALADVGDPSAARGLIERAQAAPGNDETWARIARLPVEHSGLQAADLPDVADDATDARFWRAVVLARLGEFAPLERFLQRRDEEPSLLWGSPWAAYDRLALVQPLPDALRTRILTCVGVTDPQDREALRHAGVLVWALSGAADAEGEPIAAAAVSGGAADARESAADAEARSSPAAADARRAVRLAAEQLAATGTADVPLEVLRGLPAAEAGTALVSIVGAANRAMAERSGEFGLSNTVIAIVSHLPRPVPLPVGELYRAWADAPHPALDAAQLAWIVARGPLPSAVGDLAGEAERSGGASLDLLAHVGDVVSGRAGSPYRGEGPGGSPAIASRELIDDEPKSRRHRGPSRRGPAGAEREEIAEPAILSAEGPKMLAVGQSSAIRVRIERPDGARPLAHAVQADILDAPISVIVFLDSESVRLTDPVLKVGDAPAAGRPTELAFAIEAQAPGTSTAIVHFQQGATRLAMLSFPIGVAAAGEHQGTARAEGTAAAPDDFDAGVVRMLVQPPSSDAPYYTYYVTSPLLGLTNAPFTSPPLAGDGSGAARIRRFAESIYRRIETALVERQADARLLKRRLEDIGADMCRQLFPETLVRALWTHRDRIAAIEITPVEPYVPWELLRLQHPEEGADDRHLAEYRLVRVLGGKEPARALGRTEWRYVLGDYPNALYMDLPAEREFVTAGLQALGVTASAIPASVEDILDAVDPAAFDVLHIACHGEASLDDIDASALIIADRLSQQGPVGVRMVPADLSRSLTPRRPIVFLSACQSGRLAPSLSDLGGWPKVLSDAQAGAMVGTSWTVHEKPAVAFATAFYGSLLSGATLAEAAGAGRAAARDKGDASWLAYTVYGWPSARMNR